MLAFPARTPRDTSTPTRTAPRWIAAAAAVGLFVGVAAGRLYGPAMTGSLGGPLGLSRGPAHITGTDPRAPRVNPVVSATVPLAPGLGDAAAEGRFLDELELALEQPQTSALVAFDTLTPHVREIGAVVR